MTTPMTSNLELRLVDCDNNPKRKGYAIVHARTGLVLVFPSARQCGAEKLADRYAFFVCWLEAHLDLDADDAKAVHASIAALSRPQRQQIAQAAKDPGAPCADCGTEFAVSAGLCTRCSPERRTAKQSQQEALAL